MVGYTTPIGYFKAFNDEGDKGEIVHMGYKHHRETHDYPDLGSRPGRLFFFNWSRINEQGGEREYTLLEEIPEMTVSVADQVMDASYREFVDGQSLQKIVDHIQRCLPAANPPSVKYTIVSQRYDTETLKDTGWNTETIEAIR